MRNKKYIVTFIIFMLIVNLVFGANAKKIIKKFQKQYNNVEFTEVIYEEVVTLQISNTTQKNNGHLIMSNKNQFKLITDMQEMAMDGKSFYRLNKQTNQLTIDYIKKSDDMLFFQKMFYKAEDNFYLNLIDEMKMDGKKIFIIKLTPKEDSNQLFKEIKLWIMDKTWFVPRFEMIDLNDNKTKFKILKLNIDKKFKVEDFIIKGDEKTEIIDLRL